MFQVEVDVHSPTIQSNFIISGAGLVSGIWPQQSAETTEAAAIKRIFLIPYLHAAEAAYVSFCASGYG